MRTDNILNFSGARYLWIALILCVTSIALYFTHGKDQLANGGTWQGYTLGTIGALLIAWLSMLGIRKRRYSSRMGTVMGWTSAHIYLGLSLIVVATFHTGFEFSWNVHLLAYLLMLFVIISGIAGTTFYVMYPRVSFLNRNSLSAQKLEQQATKLQEKILADLPLCTDVEQRVITSAVEHTEPLKNGFAALIGKDGSYFETTVDGVQTKVANAEQQGIRRWLAMQLTTNTEKSHTVLMDRLLEAFSDYSALLKRLRQERRMQVLLKIWLSIHIPCTLALLCALTIHIITTFLYW